MCHSKKGHHGTPARLRSVNAKLNLFELRYDLYDEKASSQLHLNFHLDVTSKIFIESFMSDKNNEESHPTCSQGRLNDYTRLNRNKKEAIYPSVGQRFSVSENAHRPSCIQAGRIA